MPTPAEKDRAKKGIKARQDALKTLITNHQAEFDELVANNRIAAGLPRRPSGPSQEQLQQRVQRAEEQLEKWRQELARSA
jgi:hypothetical protein